MNTHPMKYVSMIKLLLRMKDKCPLREGDEELLSAAQVRLEHAAIEEAAAYREFHALIQALAPTNELAAAMVKQTYTDLT